MSAGLSPRSPLAETQLQGHNTSVVRPDTARQMSGLFQCPPASLAHPARPGGYPRRLPRAQPRLLHPVVLEDPHARNGH